MHDSTYVSFERFIENARPPEQPSREDATADNPRFEFRLMRSDGDKYPDKSDIESIVYLSHDSPRIRRAHLDSLPIEKRRGLYTEWFLGNPRCFGLLERFPADEFENTVIGNTAILPLTQNKMQKIIDGIHSVIDLSAEDLCSGDNFDVLLIDTWVLHIDYQKKSSWWTRHKRPIEGSATAWSCDIFLNFGPSLLKSR